jgi:hypothetical protein
LLLDVLTEMDMARSLERSSITGDADGTSPHGLEANAGPHLRRREIEDLRAKKRSRHREELPGPRAPRQFLPHGLDGTCRVAGPNAAC